MQCRALELDEMMKAVSQPVVGGSRSVMQLLPRHMRRRAANHDVRRLPLKRRLEAQTDVCCSHFSLLSSPLLNFPAGSKIRQAYSYSIV